MVPVVRDQSVAYNRSSPTRLPCLTARFISLRWLDNQGSSGPSAKKLSGCLGCHEELSAIRCFCCTAEGAATPPRTHLLGSQILLRIPQLRLGVCVRREAPKVPSLLG
eukprot:GHVS01098983.1.p1 GENE.GHVS01098983.1~~GHVS01098983.1.p1  ORF type:complete len:108 (-),score=1.66 GHVS01098983.1:337-660(-)